MFKKFVETITEYKMLEGKKGVVAAVSGGADSVCLFLLLMEYIKNTDMSLKVVHVEHGIRGAESFRDADFVEKMCQEAGISCKIVHVDVPAEVALTGESEEEAARRLRYEALYENLEDGEVLAVAHHMMDQAETVLLNILRGSHVKGICGMSPVNGNVIRPLLFVSRNEIETYLRERGVSWCEDCTNNDIDITRNLIRKEIMPLFEKVNTDAVGHLCRLAQDMTAVETYLDGECEKNFEKATVAGDGKITLLKDVLDDVDIEIKERIIYKSFVGLAGRAKDISKIHVKAIEELFLKQVSRKISLPYECEAVRTYQGVEIRKMGSQNHVNDEQNTKFTLSVEILDISQVGEAYKEKNDYTKYFDYDIINGNVKMRFLEKGDDLVIDNKGHRKNLMDYLADQKVPLDERKNVSVLADDREVLWVIGHRISERFRITENTKKILKASVKSETGE